MNGVRQAASGADPWRWAVAAWVATAIAGTWLLADYGATPGTAAQSVGRWPAGSALPAPEGPALLVFLHPECPCSRATVAELAKLLTHIRGRVRTSVVFSARGDTLRAAVSRLPVAVFDDEDGREARRFGATTSGHAFYFAASGKRLFHGGLTEARAHHGDNAGAASVRALAAGRAAPPTSPVYGCPLFAGDDRSERSIVSDPIRERPRE